APHFYFILFVPLVHRCFPEMMNTEQAARYIGIDTGTLRKWARNGDIPAHKVGPKLWRFFKSELAERMEMNENI
ncbi:MAG: helix-turn-helix domain-containing protein, partial [[Eubacterium] siraeum]